MTVDIRQGATTKSAVTRTTNSEPERALLRKWCDIAAANGGSFSIDHAYTRSEWVTTYTINWPSNTDVKDIT